MKKKDDDLNYTKYLSFVGVPFLLVVAPTCGFFIGYALDKYFNTKPYLAYIFLVLGIIAGIREFYRLVKEIGNIDNDKPDH